MFIHGGDMEIVITEQNGWSKPVKVEKSILRIGSGAANEIQLSSPQIAPLHLQVFYSPEATSRVLNLAGAVTLQAGGSSSEILPFMTQDLKDGDEVILGEFKLLFRMPLSSGLVRPSRMIEASLTFPEAVLRSQVSSVGLLKIKNKGEKDGQFQVTLNGLPADCYQVDPVPLMYPGAQEEIRLRLFHKKTHPQAGFLTVTLMVSAPESYPGEEVLLQQKIYVEPIFNQVLEIKDDLEAPPASPAEKAAAITDNLNEWVAASNESLKPEQPATPEPISEETLAPISRQPARPAKANPAPLQNVDLSKLKVVRGPSEEFWDE